MVKAIDVHIHAPRQGGGEASERERAMNGWPPISISSRPLRIA